LFRQLFNSKVSLKIPLKTKDDIDQSICYLNQAITNSVKEATPTTINSARPAESVCYPIYIKKRIAEKRRLRRIWQNSRHPLDKNAFNHAAQSLKRMLLSYKNKCFSDFTKNLSSTEDTDYSLWKATKYLKRPKQHVPPVRNIDGTWAKSNVEKAASFARHFTEVFKPYPQNPQMDDGEIHDYLDSPFQLSPPIQPFKFSEVKHFVLKTINPKKSPGLDLINGKLLQELPRKGLMLLTFIFNAILRIEYFPSQWKVAQLVVVPKTRKATS